MRHVLLGMAVLHAILLPFGARAGAEFQLLQFMGKQKGNPYVQSVRHDLLCGSNGNFYGATDFGGSYGAGFFCDPPLVRRA